MEMNEVFTFLELEVNDKLNRMRLEYDGSEFEKKVNAMSVLFAQKNIMAITDDRSIKQTIAVLTQEEHVDVRMEFLLQITAKLKFLLGAEGWDELCNRLLGSLRIVTPNMPESKVSRYSMLGEINASLLKINMDVVDVNHWIVPLILFGLHNRIPVQIKEYLIELDTILSSQDNKKRRYGPANRFSY